MKKVISLVMAVLILMVPMASSAENNDGIIGFQELQLITSDFVMSNILENDECTWNINMQARDAALYGMDEAVNAYYIAFNNEDGTPNGYLVVNASVNNPSVLEFAFGTQHDEIQKDSKTYYATFGTYLTKELDPESNQDVFKCDGKLFAPVSEAVDKINQIWSGMNSINTKAKVQLQNIKKCTEKNSIQQMPPQATDSWGIFTSLPSGNWVSADTLKGCAVAVPYYRTKDFSGSNHCGAIAAMNVLKYYGARLSYNFVKPSPKSAFNYLYKNTGNGGPTLPGKLLTALKNYIKDRKNSGSLPSSTSISTYQYGDRLTYYNNMKSCINNGRMPLTNIWKGFESHWVNIVAYYLYSNGNCYVRIVNNWNKDINRYYTFQTGYQVNGNIGALIAVKITK